MSGLPATAALPLFYPKVDATALGMLPEETKKKREWHASRELTGLGIQKGRPGAGAAGVMRVLCLCGPCRWPGGLPTLLYLSCACGWDQGLVPE